MSTAVRRARRDEPLLFVRQARIALCGPFRVFPPFPCGTPVPGDDRRTKSKHGQRNHGIVA